MLKYWNIQKDLNFKTHVYPLTLLTFVVYSLIQEQNTKVLVYILSKMSINHCCDIFLSKAKKSFFLFFKFHLKFLLMLFTISCDYKIFKKWFKIFSIFQSMKRDTKPTRNLLLFGFTLFKKYIITKHSCPRLYFYVTLK